jgi:hypothetical protein
VHSSMSASRYGKITECALDRRLLLISLPKDLVHVQLNAEHAKPEEVPGVGHHGDVHELQGRLGFNRSRAQAAIGWWTRLGRGYIIERRAELELRRDDTLTTLGRP